MKKLNILFILLLCAFATTAQNKPNVTITGKLVNTTVKPTVIIEQDNFVFINFKTYEAVVNADSTFTLKFYLAAPASLKLINQQAFAEPGDSVFVTITGKGYYPHMVFEGSKAYQYNYFENPHDFFLTYKAAEAAAPKFADTPDALLLYKQKSYTGFEAHNAKLQAYCKRYSCSVAFKNYAYAELYYQYLAQLLTKYTKVNKLVPVEQPVADQYFNGITPAALQNESYIASRQYVDCLYTYTRDYFIKAAPGQPYNTRPAETIKFINSHFTGTTKDEVLAETLVFYLNKGDQIYHDELLLESKKSNAYFLDKTFNDKLEPYYSKYFSYNLDITGDQETQLISLDNGKQTLGKLIAANKGKVIYIDLWASWCSPCRAQIPYGKTLAASYAGKDVQFIYLSVDADAAAWRKAFTEEQMSSSNSFLVDKNFKSFFAKRIYVSSIPRYVVIDKQGRINIAAAPRPSEDAVKTVLDNLLAK